jgi:three-Cys-motif partner protein
MTKRPDHAWISQKLANLTEHSEGLVDTGPEATNNYRPMTALKLIVLAAGVDVFSKIAPDLYDHTYYLDLFAGSGVTKLRGRDDHVVGSPILAPVMSHDLMDEYHFVDNDKTTVEALRTRLDYMADVTDFPRKRCQVHHCDATTYVHQFMDDREDDLGPSLEGLNLFTFIDPEGLDPQWPAVRRLGDAYGDLLIHFPKVGANRQLGKNSTKARQYFGTSEWEHRRSENQRLQLYTDQLTSCKNTDITVPIRIDSGESGQRFHYDLIYATRRTENNSPYVAAMESTKTKIESLNGDHIDRVLQTIRGENQRLLGEMFSSEHDDGDDDSVQSGMSDFR